MGDALRIGLIGFGNIGAGVIETLRTNHELLAARCPRPLQLRRVADIDLDRPRHVTVERELLTTDSDSVIQDPEIDVILELIGGTGVAKTIVESALNAGKHVVTANKALLATHGAELLGLAAEKGVRLLFEAAVGGGIPVVRALCESLAADRIVRIHGILNGTCNFILSQMVEADMSFAEALEQAQELGYAEPDPTADIEGLDAANKIAILASLAFGRDIRLNDVYREGITQLKPQDLRAAEMSGYVIKHRATAELGDDGRVSIGVRPTLLWADDPLATVDGVLNGIVLEGPILGSVFLAGPGAGPHPTATAVLSDVVALSAMSNGQTPPPFLSIKPGNKAKLAGAGSCNGYWMRIETTGAPAAMADTARILHDQNIPVRRMAENSGAPEDTADLRVVEVFTGRARRAAIRAAADAIEAADWSLAGGTLILPRID